MKIGLFVGDIPPPNFINELIVGLAKTNSVIIYGRKKEGNFKYNQNSIKISPRYNNKIGISFYLIFLLIKVAFNSNYSFKILLGNIYNSEKDIGNTIRKILIILPPLLDKLEVMHFQWPKSILLYPEIVDNIRCPIILSLRGTHINISPLVNINITKGYKKYFHKINFHAVSNSISKEAEKYGADRKKIRVIYPAIDEKIIKKFSGRTKSNHQQINIISIGRCNWVKGYTWALDSMVLLKKENINFNYTIIGSGVDSENLLYQISDLNLENEVSFINGLAHQKVLKKLSDSDILILPSFMEGISNSVLEAMAIGVPVISTDCGGMGEIIINDKNGFLVPVRDPCAMVLAIQKYFCLDETGKMTIIKNARETIIYNHLLANQIDHFQSLYRKIVQ